MNGAMAGHHFVKDYAETPDIGALINRRAARLFWRHVTNGSEYRAQVGLDQQERLFLRHRYRHFLFGKLCNPKVEHFHVSVRPEHDVLGFDVAMDDSGFDERRRARLPPGSQHRALHSTRIRPRIRR